MKSVCSCLILIFVLLSVSLIPAQSQAREDLELAQEVQEANSLINQNQILKSIQNGSDQVGIGTVQDITYGAEKSGAIFTYAKIVIDSPFTSNLRAQQVITAKYPGGHVGNITIIPNYLWVSYKNDTVKLPETYDLTKGSQILFFINETSNYLMGYLPSSTFASSIDDFLESSMTPLTLGNEPTSYVYESTGYGFGWGGLHYHFDDMPLRYSLDPDGTADVGDDSEFDAIRAAFSTWDYDTLQCAISFVEDTSFSGNYVYWGDWDQAPDGYSVVGWAPDYYNPNILALNFPKTDYTGHLVENDIMVNDADYAWATYQIYPWEFDIQNVLTHEVGHTLCLNDLYDSGSAGMTMYSTANCWYETRQEDP